MTEIAKPQELEVFSSILYLYCPEERTNKITLLTWLRQQYWSLVGISHLNLWFILIRWYTGANRGMGLAFEQQYVQRGWTVHGTYRKQSREEADDVSTHFKPPRTTTVRLRFWSYSILDAKYTSWIWKTKGQWSKLQNILGPTHLISWSIAQVRTACSVLSFPHDNLQMLTLVVS